MKNVPGSAYVLRDTERGDRFGGYAGKSYQNGADPSEEKAGNSGEGP